MVPGHLSVMAFYNPVVQWTIHTGGRMQPEGRFINQVVEAFGPERMRYSVKGSRDTNIGGNTMVVGTIE